MHYQRWWKNGDPNVFKKTGRHRIPFTPCAVEGCGERGALRGWCRPHYKSWQRYGDPTVARKRGSQRPPCTVDGCGEVSRCRDLCALHYERWRRTGTTDPQPEKTRCKYGHPLSGDNLAIRRNPDGSARQRVCRACTRASVERTRARQRAGVA